MIKKLQFFLDRSANASVELFRVRDFIFIKFGAISALALFLGLFGFIFCLQCHGVENRVITALVFLLPANLILFSYVLNYIMEFKTIIRKPVLMRKVSFGFFGGFIGVLITILEVTYFYGVSFYAISDSMMFTPLAHAIARLGCINYGCCHGRVIENFSDNPRQLHLNYTNSDSKAVRTGGLLDKPLYPIQLYEIAGCLVNQGALITVALFNARPGTITWLYLLNYGVLRLVCEFFRGEKGTPRIFGLTIYQHYSLMFILAGLGILAATMNLNIGHTFSINYRMVSSAMTENWFPLLLMPFTIFVLYGFHYKRLGRWS